MPKSLLEGNTTTEMKPLRLSRPVKAEEASFLPPPRKRSGEREVNQTVRKRKDFPVMRLEIALFQRLNLLPSPMKFGDSLKDINGATLSKKGEFSIRASTGRCLLLARYRLCIRESHKKRQRGD